jgi:ubiquinone/menaquinone biosynthesis C-methylase UbiE
MAATRKPKKNTQNFYDRIAEVHNLALKVNGYRRSMAKYLRSLDLEIGPDSAVLDAGSGTGIVSLGFQDSGLRPKIAVTFDLSRSSLKVGREEFSKQKRRDPLKIAPTQGNILNMPFADDTFDLILTCGVLEYVNLDDGLRELARVLKPGGKLVLIPVKPSLVGTMLKFLYKFRIHRVEDVRTTANRYFNIINTHEFPLNEPMSWSKILFLLEKDLARS